MSTLTKREAATNERGTRDALRQKVCDAAAEYARIKDSPQAEKAWLKLMLALRGVDRDIRKFVVNGSKRPGQFSAVEMAVAGVTDRHTNPLDLPISQFDPSPTALGIDLEAD